MVSVLFQVLTSSAKESTLLCALLGSSLFGWAVKQAVNVIQVVIYACVLLEKFTCIHFLSKSGIVFIYTDRLL